LPKIKKGRYNPAFVLLGAKFFRARSIVTGNQEKKMSLGLVGRKVGMTRIFAEDGRTIPVTVLDVSNNRVTQIKTPEVDGYAAVQVTFGKRRASRVNKPLAGHLAKAGVEAGHILKEFRVDVDQLSKLKAGDVLSVDLGGAEGGCHRHLDR
jgi:ribosomal protein L3